MLPTHDIFRFLLGKPSGLYPLLRESCGQCKSIRCVCILPLLSTRGSLARKTTYIGAGGAAKIISAAPPPYMEVCGGSPDRNPLARPDLAGPHASPRLDSLVRSRWWYTPRSMKLRDHSALLDGWFLEPVGGSFSRSHVAPIDCLDTLREVFLQRAVGSDVPSVALLTVYCGEEHTRDLRVRSGGFAQHLFDFLCAQKGKTIREIGDHDVDVG